MITLSRRQFLALSATVAIAGCSAGDEATNTTGSPEPIPSPTDTAVRSSAPTTNPTTTPTATTTTATTTTTTTTTTTEPAVELLADPFTLGVASGDPDDTSVVLWTRLSGELPAEIPVIWQLLDGDEVVDSGVEVAAAEQAHTVHAIVPIDRPLAFRFTAGGWESTVGQTQPAGARDELRIAAASCQHFETGFYAAHRDIAEWAPDLTIFLGDFIYEGAANPIGDAIVRTHDGPEITEIGAYRARYALYLSDADLRASRAACPWVTIWDDHEVENNYAGLVPENPADAATFDTRRAQAYQAWWEHTPTRLPPPVGTEPYTIYRGVDYGDLLSLSVLDGRQFRDDQECGSPTLSPDPPCEEVFAPDRTMLGADQEAWLADRFTSATALWNVLGQQTVLTDVRLPNGAILNYDQWDGYPAARDRLLADAPSDLVVLTGDIHLAGVGSLGGAGAEFVCTSISSAANVDPSLQDFVRELPGIVDAELEHRGYVRHSVTRDRWTAEYRIVDDVADAMSTVSTWKTYGVTPGNPAPVEMS